MPASSPSFPFPHSFLKVLCGRMVKNSDLDVQGDVRFNGHTFKEFNVVRTAGFVGQVSPGLDCS